MRHLAVALALIVLVKSAPDEKDASRKTTLTDESRLALIRKAQVWTKTDVPNMNLRTGPGGHGAFEPNQTVTCDYVETRMHGSIGVHAVN